MPVAPVTYHWAEADSVVINPETFTNYTSTLTLPPKHTLRRILLAEPQCFWRRGTNLYDDLQSYFVAYRVVYGATESAPILYRTIRRVPFELVSDASSLTQAFLSLHSAAYLELGMNERVARGGFYSDAQPLTINWSIDSSGTGSERLSGQANMTLRALYSLPVEP